MTDLDMQLVLRLVDRATGPARAALQRIQQTGAAMERSGRGTIALADRMAERSQRHMAALPRQITAVGALGGAIVALTEPAVRAEAAMAEVAKTVDFEGKTGIARLQRDIYALVTTGGLTNKADEIMDIVAAAGRMGVVDANLPDAEKREAYLAFATNAAKMSEAFGISADEAATSLARWQNNLGLSSDEALVLANRINYLGNNYGTSEAHIMQVMIKQAAFAKQAGLTTHATAALSTALLDAGVAPDIAATGMKNFLRVLAQGESVTDRQRRAFEALGIAPEELAKAMQTDATGAIFSVLDAFAGVEDYRRTAVVGELFGQESIEAVSQLLLNTERYRGMLEETADASRLLGLMEEEYQRKAETTRAQRQRLFSYFESLGVVIGGQLLPMLNSALETMMPVLGALTQWADAHPQLLKYLGWLVAGLFGFRLALLALRFAFGPLLWLAARAVRHFGKLQLAVAALARLRPLRLAALVKPLKWTARLIPAIPWLALVGGRFLISTLLAPLRWTARLIPAISWLALTGGKFALAGLVTALKWTARLIPVIGWALLAGELLWHLLIKPLGWDKYLPAIDWSRVWGAFSWEGWLPRINWASSSLRSTGPTGLIVSTGRSSSRSSTGAIGSPSAGPICCRPGTGARSSRRSISVPGFRFRSDRNSTSPITPA